MDATQKRQNQFPKGWDEKRVLQVLAHYEKQSDEEAIAEAENLQVLKPSPNGITPARYGQPSKVAELCYWMISSCLRGLVY